jgi:glucokinase
MSIASLNNSTIENNIALNTIIGVDLGGTKLHAARTIGQRIATQSRQVYDANASAEAVLQTIIDAIERHLSPDVKGIGVGVPSVVDPLRGIVYEVANIPAWREIHLKDRLESHFNLPVKINNDVNCFSLGEYYFGNWQETQDMVCMSLGTGMGVGLIFAGKLYTGQTCGAGELGELPYGDSKLENYCSGQFFTRNYDTTGTDVFNRASHGEETALEIYRIFGEHLAQALSTVLLAYNPQMVVIGGSVSAAYPFFIDSLNKSMKKFTFQSLWQSTRLVKSQNSNTPVLGAAALFQL